MSLYYEAAAILQNAENTGGSLTSRVYGKKDLKSKPAAIYALVTEATKWSAVLKHVVETSGILAHERKLTPLLAVLLAHDLLLSKRGVAAPATHPLKLAITKHKARLSAEFTKARVKRGFGTVEAFRQHVNAGADAGDANGGSLNRPEHPRWVRVNAVRTSLRAQLDTTFKDYERKKELAEVMSASPNAKVLHIDEHIPDLLALPPRTDLSKNMAYQTGELILQDKASCFPAYLLNVQPDDGHVVDACAAPGNKTTHLAALISSNASSASKRAKQRIFACERDKRRSAILEKMVNLAGAGKLVTIKSQQDFLNVSPKSEAIGDVGALLLDPSCSGSGIVGRDDDVKLVLPSASAPTTGTEQNRGKKRKRKPSTAAERLAATAPTSDTTVSLAEETPSSTDSSASLQARLESLSAFQLKLLCHAMAFPHARKITYSTCSVHAEENEHVVLKALASSAATKRGWRVLKREEQVDGMKRWPVRGEMEACRSAEGVEVEGRHLEEVKEACIRCEKGTTEGTMGFFVAALVRDGNGEEEEQVESAGTGEEGNADEGEWNGFGDDE